MIPRVPSTDKTTKPSWYMASDAVGKLRVVVVTCGLCGRQCVLEHHVDDKGIVSPSVVCPNTVCGWHVTAELAGWPP